MLLVSSQELSCNNFSNNVIMYLTHFECLFICIFNACVLYNVKGKKILFKGSIKLNWTEMKEGKKEKWKERKERKEKKTTSK